MEKGVLSPMFSTGRAEFLRLQHRPFLPPTKGFRCEDEERAQRFSPYQWLLSSVSRLVLLQRRGHRYDRRPSPLLRRQVSSSSPTRTPTSARPSQKRITAARRGSRPTVRRRRILTCASPAAI